MLYNDIITQCLTTILLLNALQRYYYSMLYNEIITSVRPEIRFRPNTDRIDLIWLVNLGVGFDIM